jgi:hypothetical protein
VEYGALPLGFLCAAAFAARACCAMDCSDIIAAPADEPAIYYLLTPKSVPYPGLLTSSKLSFPIVGLKETDQLEGLDKGGIIILN